MGGGGTSESGFVDQVAGAAFYNILYGKVFGAEQNGNYYAAHDPSWHGTPYVYPLNEPLNPTDLYVGGTSIGAKLETAEDIVTAHTSSYLIETFLNNAITLLDASGKYSDRSGEVSSLLATVVGNALSNIATALSNAYNRAMINAPVMLGAISSRADTEARDTITAIDQSITSERIESLVEDASTTALDLTVTNIANAHTDASTKSSAEMTTARAASVADLSTVFNILYGIVVDGTGVGYSIADIVTNSITLADANIADSVIDDLLTAFETSGDAAFLRGVGRFASGMSEIGAVNSSAFLLGLSIMESDRQNDLNKFRAEVKLRVFEKSIDSYLTLFQSSVQNLSALYIQGVTETLSAYKLLVPTHIQGILALIPQYLQTYLQEFAETMTTQRSNTVQGTQLMITQGQEYLNTFSNTLAGHLDSQIKDRLENKQAYHQAMLLEADSALRFESFQIDAYRAWIEEYLNYTNNRYTTMQDYKERRLEFYKNETLWNFDLLARVANIMAAGAGGVNADDKTTPFQRGVAGLAAGAVSGATLGSSIGGPGLGAGIGAGVGAAIGLATSL